MGQLVPVGPESAGGGGSESFIAGDPLRGLAAVGVFVLHAGGAALVATGYAGMFPGVAGRLDAYGDLVGSAGLAGYFGVWVFFVLSGYLIGRPFVRAMVEGGPLPSITRYARNRALRILPAYWVVLTVVLAVVALTGSVALSAGQAIGLYGLLLPDENPLGAWTDHVWTLEVEAKFYVTMPLVALVATPVVRALPSRRARALAIVGPCLVALVVAPFLIEDLNGHSFVSLLRLFAAGIAFAALEPIVRPLLAGRGGWAVAATVGFVGSAVWLLAFPALYERVGSPFDAGVGRLALELSIAGLVGWPLVRQWAGYGCWRVIDNPATRWLGARSYSFYLVHMAVVWELSQVLAQVIDGYKVVFVALLLVGGSASALAAEVLYRAVERPFLDRKRKVDMAVGRQVPRVAAEVAPESR